ncbi:hypothetical protein FQN54_008316 [Arachnomyces sp. PD_36]|nr:hypothetical protein FQN54_008316 [Arachnomyces sp. PD_36]
MDQQAPLTSWPENFNSEALVPTSGVEDEFSNFLEFGFTFPELENGAVQNPRSLAQPPTSSMEDVDMMRMSQAQATEGQTQTAQAVQQNTHQPAQVMTDMSSVRHPGQEVKQHYQDPNMESQFYQGRQQQQSHQPPHQQQQQPPPHMNPNYAHRYQGIPPTPNSIELHGGAVNRYPGRMENEARGYEHYSRPNDDQSAFTPLMSPAVTPLDTQFCLPEYTIPGEYFTPLTSPALEARQSNGNGYMYNATQAPDLGFLASPIDPFNHVPTSSAPSSPAITKKQRRKPSTSTRAATRTVRQSPSVRPQSRRKPHSGSTLNPDDNTSRGSGGYHHNSSNENSAQDSVSPEPLSEPLMPPPAVPRSGKSTFNTIQESGPDSKSSEAAATPATLMKLQKQHAHTENTGPQFSGTSTVVVNDTPDEVMTDANTSSNTNPGVARIDTTSNEQTPTLLAKGVSPNSAGPLAEKPLPSPAAPSPRIGASSSPAIAPKRGDSKTTGRVSKKRQSVNSSQASPALRPKISPSIQPLIRNDGVSPESSAVYLASKSNYQHLLDGTLLPGVSYPEALAENLSSKRTNHKLAEQGRRNRINSALKEIEALLPPGFAAERCKDTGEGTPGTTAKDKSGNQPVSKASTVEMAIDYIKQLRSELDETKEKLKAAEMKNGNDERPGENGEPTNGEAKQETPN